MIGSVGAERSFPESHRVSSISLATSWECSKPQLCCFTPAQLLYLHSVNDVLLKVSCFREGSTAHYRFEKIRQ